MNGAGNLSVVVCSRKLYTEPILPRVPGMMVGGGVGGSVVCMLGKLKVSCLLPISGA